MSSPPEISIVVPLFNEEENIGPLVRSVRSALVEEAPWELILVDDGSADRTFETACRAAKTDTRIRVLRLARNYGQTTALQAGFDDARGEILVSIDGDLQNDPNDIPMIAAKIRDGYGLVAGYRESRTESLLTRQIPSWVANRLIALITRVPIRDNGCTLKAFRREVVADLRLYSDMHRFIPALIAGRAETRITQVQVRHHARKFGRTKYGLSRVWKVLTDLLAIMMLRWFRERPLVMFGWAATGFGMVGFVFLAATLYAATTFRAFKATAVVFPGATFLWFGLAGYLLMLGLVCEVALREMRVNRPAADPAERMND